MLDITLEDIDKLAKKHFSWKPIQEKKEELQKELIELSIKITDLSTTNEEFFENARKSYKIRQELLEIISQEVDIKLHSLHALHAERKI